jgi:hypothetical protein
MKKKITKIVAVFILLLVANKSLAQHEPWVRYGSLDSRKISVEEFNLQHSLEIEKGYTIDSAYAFFCGANFSSMHKINFVSEYDSIRFSELKELLVPGSAINFQVFTKQKLTGKPFRVCFNYTFYGTKKTIPAPPSESYKEVKRLSGLNYISGTLYFKAAHSDDLSIYLVSQQDKEGLENLFNRLYPGASVIFDNVTYKDEQGNINKLNMTFKVE